MKNKVHKNKHKEHFDFSEYSSSTIFRLFSEFFNKLIYNEAAQKKYGVKVVAYIKNKEFVDSIRIEERYTETQVLLEFDGILVNIHFEVYKQHGEVYYHIYITSNVETTYDVDSFYKELLGAAIELSDLKGSAFKMPRNELEWEKLNISDKDFGDIFLPNSTLEDLKLYINTAKSVGMIMRYLLVGNPGTGKTEATTIIANLLNKEKVTIIKTSVCDKIEEKFQLAELLAPSIVMIDDIDLSLGSRNKGVYPERLQDFLDILDGTEKLKKNVGVIATTNSTALLDSAVQRPGRFDKILVFDELSKENVRNIILKSLSDNFKIKSESNKIVSLFAHSNVVKLFFESGMTGSYIYNKIKVLKIKADMIKKSGDLTIEWILKELRSEMETIKKVKNTDFLGDKLSGSRKNIGFGEDEESVSQQQNKEEVTPQITEEELADGEVDYENEQNSNLRKKIIRELKGKRTNLGGLLSDD